MVLDIFVWWFSIFCSSPLVNDNQKQGEISYITFICAQFTFPVLGVGSNPVCFTSPFLDRSDSLVGSLSEGERFRQEREGSEGHRCQALSGTARHGQLSSKNTE